MDDPTGQKETWTDTSSLIKTWITWVHNTLFLFMDPCLINEDKGFEVVFTAKLYSVDGIK